jgi:hypothetical protein
LGGLAAQVLAAVVGGFGGQRTDQKAHRHGHITRNGGKSNCPRIASLRPFQGPIQTQRLSLGVLQPNILPMHAQQDVGSRFGHHMDASGMLQSPVPADNLPRPWAASVQPLTPLAVGNLLPDTERAFFA